MQGSALGFRGQHEMQPPTGGEPLPSTTGAIRAPNWSGRRLMPRGTVGKNEKQKRSLTPVLTQQLMKNSTMPKTIF